MNPLLVLLILMAQQDVAIASHELVDGLVSAVMSNIASVPGYTFEAEVSF